ncbi:hypothetical protein GCM10027187_13590 [Streptosporangium sandarakinum]|uniref:hypothetical protein n=1 Tax=Streptosporangium sandarakinum TaxID=1260955 RepID=UPI0015C6F33E|nr:hypothetical protein [Streptosporangium sandarakinum]
MQVEGIREPAVTRADVSLQEHRERRELEREAAGKRWQEHGLVFAPNVGTHLDAHNVRRAFRKVLQNNELNPKEWTPRKRQPEDGLSPNRSGRSKTLPEGVVTQIDTTEALTGSR